MYKELTILFPFVLFAANPVWTATISKIMSVGGGPGASGPPGVYQVVTNVATSGTTLSKDCDFSSNTSRVALVWINWYPDSSAITSVTIAGTNANKLTNGFWFGTGAMELWGLTPPASGSQTVTVNWGGAVTEADMEIIALTNANQSTPYNIPTNVGPVTVAFITNHVQSANGEMIISASTYADSPIVPTSTGQTLLTNCPVGSGMHSSSVTSKKDTFSISTNWFQWESGAINQGMISISIRGL